MTISTADTADKTETVKRTATLKERIWEALKPDQDQWNDWKWHFRNRFNNVEKLAKVKSSAVSATATVPSG